MGSYLSTDTTSPRKVILITGASAGIGKDAALTMVHRGHTVYGAARRVDQMQELVKAGGHAMAMDVTKEAEVVEAVKRIIKEQGRIDVLINNAGMSVPGPVEEQAMAQARHIFEVNLFGLARLTQEVIPHMRKAESGTIVNVSSVVGKTYFPFGAWYAASKHALEGWSDCLRLELTPFNIKVAIIQPGGVRTEFRDAAYGDGDEVANNGSPYEKYVQTYNKKSGELAEKGSPPSVITDLMIHASESASPKRRYVGGYGAKPIFFMRTWLGDGVLDSFYLDMMKPY